MKKQTVREDFWEEFKRGNVAVQCNTLEKCKAFVDEFIKNVNDKDMEFKNYMFDRHKDKTCIQYSKTSNEWGYIGLENAMRECAKIVKFEHTLEGVDRNRIVYFIVDVSGSMHKEKRDVVKKLLNKYREDYKTVKTIYHTTSASFGSIDRAEAGGTYMSSGIGVAMGDIFVNGYEDCIFVQVGDGDNWSEDNNKLKTSVQKLISEGYEYHYYEIYPIIYSSTIYKQFSAMELDEDMCKLHKFANEKEVDKFLGIETKTEVKIYQVEHTVGGNLYDFISDDEQFKNRIVVCDTIKGETYGKIINVFTKNVTEEELKKYKKCAYHRDGLN